MTTYPHGGAAEIFRDMEGAVAHKPVKSQVRDWGVRLEKSGFPTPAFSVPQNAADNSVAIQAALDAGTVLMIPASYGEIVIDRPMLFNDHQRFFCGANIVRADGMHDVVWRPKNSAAHLVGNRHPGASHPFSARNVFWPDASGDRQTWEVGGRVVGRTYDIWMDTFWHTGASPVGKVNIGDIKTTEDGLRWQVVADDHNTPVVNKNGVRFIPALNYDIEIMNLGGKFDGNGANNREDSDTHFTYWQRYRRHIGIAAGLRRFRVTGAQCKNSALYNMYLTDVRDAIFTNVEFDQASFAELGHRNGDGLHIDIGCHDITLDGCYGATSDDVFALVATRPMVARSYDHADPDNLFPVTMTKLNGRYPFYDARSWHNSKVKVRTNHALPINTNYGGRIIWSDGHQVDTVSIIDATGELSADDAAGNAYGRVAAASVIRIGGKRFGIEPAAPGDGKGFTIKAVAGSARSVVEFGWSCDDVSIDGIVTEYSDQLASEQAEDADALIRGQNGVTFQPGNDVVERMYFKAAPGVTLPAPRFHRRSRDLNALLGAITYVKTDSELIADAAGHDLTRTFRATVTVLDSSGVAVPGLPSFDFSIEIVRDADAIPTGDLKLVFDDDFLVDIDDIPASGRLALIDKGSTSTQRESFTKTNDRYNNGSLRVYKNGALLTPVTDYTETTGMDPWEEQEITPAASWLAGDVWRIERFEFPSSVQAVYNNIRVNGIEMRGDKPTNNPIVERRPLDWGVGVEVRPYNTINRLHVADLRAQHCRHALWVQEGSRLVDYVLDGVTLHETGQMPIRFEPDSLWETSKGVIRDLQTPDRTKIWQYYVASEHGAAPGFGGQVYSSRIIARFEGRNPRVRPAVSGQYGADIFPQWDRDGSDREFEAGAFPGLPFGVKGVKVGDFGATGNRWVAYALLDGTPVSAAVMPSAQGATNRLDIASGQNFSAAAPPPDGYTIRVRPNWTNTGSISVKVDAMDSIEARARQRSGSLCPAGWMVANVLVDVVWSETLSRWLIDRRIENVANANGSAVIFPDGTVEMWNTDVGSAASNLGPVSGTSYGEVRWTYPVTSLVGTPSVQSTTANSARISGGTSSVSSTGADLIHRTVTSSATPTTIGGRGIGSIL